MSKRVTIFFLGSFVFFLFVFFSYLIHKDIFTQFDFDTTVRLQDNISRTLDDEFSLLSDLGSFEVLTLVLLGIVGFFVVKRKFGAIFFLFSYTGFHVIELYGKFFVNHPPPPEFMLRTIRIFEFPQFHVRAENSYPSGHSGRTLFLTTVLVLMILSSKKLSLGVKLLLVIALVAFDIAMLVSRVYLGEHWVSDVIGGALLGAGLAVTTYAIAK